MKFFQLTEGHIRLLRKANVSWDDCEFGAPAIDCKRPFGNSGSQNILSEVADAFEIEIPNRDDEDWYIPGEIEGELRAYYVSLGTALEVVLASGSFAPGDYMADDYSANWVRMLTNEMRYE